MVYTCVYIYLFDIPIPFRHHLYLSATFKQCFTEFAGKVIKIWVNSDIK